MDADLIVNIPYLNGFDDLYAVEDISKVLDTHLSRQIYTPWSEGTKQPDASFALAYGTEDIYLKY